MTSEASVCACGCGAPLTGLQKKYASLACSTSNTRNYRLVKTYGITLSDYQKILDLQEGKCALCRNAPKDGTSLAVDHMHEDGQIGQVMGLLCFRCNKFVKGNLNIANIVALYRYVTNPPAVEALGRVVVAPGRAKKKPKKRVTRRKG